MIRKRFWSEMNDEQWEEERKRIRKLQEAHIRSAKREEVE